MDKSILKYDRDIYLKPFDEGKIMYFETILPIKGEEIKLLFPVEEVFFVTNYGLDVIYEEGKDYIVKNGKIVITKNSKIEQLEIDEYYPKEKTSLGLKVAKAHCPYKFNEDRYVMYGEVDYITKHQIAITYRHKQEKVLFEHKCQKEKLKNFYSKLEKNKEATIVFFGDSITVGCNSSGTEYGGNVPPYAESWPVMVTKAIEKDTESKINYVNTAVGGTLTEWAVENYDERVNKYHPDLVVLAFGMNDACLPIEEHIKQIKTIINGIKEKNPMCEFVLISTTVPNIESDAIDQNQKSQYLEYEKLDLDYAAYLNMTLSHLKLLERKKFKDMSANNVNHPNDFLARLYAQSVLKVMGL